MISANTFEPRAERESRATCSKIRLRKNCCALRDIAEGGAVLPPKIASKLMQTYASESRGISGRKPDELMLREIKIVELLYHGLRNNEIAGRLSISPRTV
jgi:DNA-binding NarL/FixJ family response regulator